MVPALAPSPGVRDPLQTFLECLIYVQHGYEQDRHGPCLHGATSLVGTTNSNLATCSKEVQGAVGQNEREGGVRGAPLPSACGSHV